MASVTVRGLCETKSQGGVALAVSRLGALGIGGTGGSDGVKWGAGGLNGTNNADKLSFDIWG